MKTLKSSQNTLNEQSTHIKDGKRDGIGQDISKTNKTVKKNDIAEKAKQPQDIKPQESAKSNFNESNHIGSSDINRTAVAY